MKNITPRAKQVRRQGSTGVIGSSEGDKYVFCKTCLQRPLWDMENVDILDNVVFHNKDD